MKNTFKITALWLVLISAGSAAAQSPEGEGYTFITTERGPQVCVGRWIPPREVGLAGSCEGQMYGLPQLSALSGRQTVDRLDQLLLALAAIDQKLAAGNNQMAQLIQATMNTHASIEQQARRGDEILREAIARRFDELPAEILATEAFREEIFRLREDVLAEVARQYQPRQPAGKPSPSGAARQP